MTETLLSLLQSQDVFNEKRYVRRFDYSEAGYSFISLNFAYLVDRELLMSFLRSKRMVLEGGTGGGPGASAEATVRSSRDRVDPCEKEGFLKVRVSDYQPFNYIVRSDWKEGDIMYVDVKLNRFLAREMPNYVEIKRVLYRSSGGLKVERGLLPLKLLFLVSNSPAEQIFPAKQTVKAQVSRFISGGDLLAIAGDLMRQQGLEASGRVSLHPTSKSAISMDEIIAFLRNPRAAPAILPAQNLSSLSIKRDSIIVFLVSGGQGLPALAPRGSTRVAGSLDPGRAPGTTGSGLAGVRSPGGLKPFSSSPWQGGFGVVGTAKEGVKSSGSGVIGSTKEGVKSSGEKPVALGPMKVAEKTGGSKGLEGEKVGILGSTKEGGKSGRSGVSGLCGMINPGNLCYMNAALQCLFRDPAFMAVMKSDLNGLVNEGNRLGTGGVVVRAAQRLFGEFEEAGRKGKSVDPSGFRDAYLRFQHQAEAGRQFDAQEFLGHLLDSIHEDLNAAAGAPLKASLGDPTKSSLGSTLGSTSGSTHGVFSGFASGASSGFASGNLLKATLGSTFGAISKPPLTSSDPAHRAWLDFVRRNCSPIAQKFFGQLRSALTCRICGHSAATFEVFQTASLSVPFLSAEKFKFFVFSASAAQKSRAMTCEVRSTRDFKDLPLTELARRVLRGNPSQNFRFFISTFSRQGELLPLDASLSDLKFSFAQRAERPDSTPKLCLIELEPSELDAERMPGRILLHIAISYDKFDLLGRQTLSSSPELPRFPILLRFALLRPEATVREAYLAVLRKFLRLFDPDASLDSSKGIKKGEAVLAKALWEKIERLSPENRPFVLRSGETDLFALQTQPLKKLSNSKDFLHLDVFLRSTDPTVSKNVEFYQTALKDSEDYPLIALPSAKEFKNSISLKELFALNQASEVLEGNNMWHCQKCQKPVEALKVLQMYRAPSHLIVQLKKPKDTSIVSSIPIEFSIMIREFFVSELSTEDFETDPSELQSSKPAAPKGLYELVGIINHIGAQDFGHYWSLCLVDGKWVEFNDEVVRVVPKEQINLNDAYLLFFNRKS